MQTLTDNYLTLRLVRLKRGEAWPNQGRGFWFVLAKGGKGQYASGSAAQSILPGDVLLLNCKNGGTIAVTGEEMIFWCFSVSFEHLTPLFAIGEICLLQNTTESLKSPKLYPASSSLARECHGLVATAPPQGNMDHRSQVLRVAAAVLSVEFKNTRTQRNGFARMEDHMMQAFEELSANELLTLSVGDLARKFSCSRRHLNRLFHQHFGCSVASLRMELRLLKALSLLRDQAVKIIQVAEECGFNHLGLFNACFKKRFGNTPSQWRKGALNGEKAGTDAELGHSTCRLQANGLCPLAPKQDDCTARARKAVSAQLLSRSPGPDSLSLRETLLRNIRQVGAQMKCQSRPEIAMRSSASSP